MYVCLAVMLFVGLTGLMIQSTITFAVTETNECLAYIVFEVLLLVYTLRKNKFDLRQALCGVKEAKKIFVRYISHELRTPLNTAFLGLKLLVDDFKGSDNEDDIDRYDTIETINKSVLYAVEILNGILTFDRIEAGLMELDKHDVPVASMVTTCVKGFKRQADEDGMVLRLFLPKVDRSVLHSPPNGNANPFLSQLSRSRSLHPGRRIFGLLLPLNRSSEVQEEREGGAATPNRLSRSKRTLQQLPSTSRQW